MSIGNDLAPRKNTHCSGLCSTSKLTGMTRASPDPHRNDSIAPTSNLNSFNECIKLAIVAITLRLRFLSSLLLCSVSAARAFPRLPLAVFANLHNLSCPCWALPWISIFWPLIAVTTCSSVWIFSSSASVA